MSLDAWRESGRALALREGGPPSLREADLTPRADLMPFGGLGYGTMGYQGAAWSTLRGYVFWPTLDPRKELDAFSRIEIARKVHFLKANVGLAKRILEGLTNLIVGTGLIPHAATKDDDWNHLAEAAYRARASSQLAYSINGRFTMAQAQRMMVKTRLSDGDAAVVFASSASGGALRGFYSGLQIGNPRSGLMPSNNGQNGWTDGIQYDALDRAMRYRFPNLDNEGYVDIDAENVRFLCQPAEPGAKRGASILAHAVNKMLDITELNTFVMQGIKGASQIGYYLASASEDPRLGMGAALGAPKWDYKVQTPGPNGGAPGEKKREATITLKQVFGQGGHVPALPKGVDIKQLLDTRPHPNSREFVEDFIRDICYGSGVSSDLLWNIYKLGGANVRYVLADAQTFISTQQQDLVDTWLTQDWVWTIAKEMKAGRLRPCRDPEWWIHGWVPPARVTVDYGRDGRILLDFHKYGLMTTSRFFNMQGLMAWREITGELDLITRRKDYMAKKGLTPLDLQLYNPLIARITPEQQGEVDYAEQVPKSRKGGTADDEDDDAPSEEAMHAKLRAMIQDELKEIQAA